MEKIDKYEYLLSILTEPVEIDGKKYLLKDEFDKFFIKSNKSSGARIRKFMQIIRKSSQEIRNDVQEYKRSI